MTCSLTSPPRAGFGHRFGAFHPGQMSAPQARLCRALLLCVLGARALLPAAGVQAADLAVADARGLAAALATASGGDRIVLADGEYGTLRLNPRHQKDLGRYAGPVTIAAATPGGAVFDAIDLRQAENLAFEGLTIRTALIASNEARQISVTGSTAQKMRFSSVEGVRVEGNHIEGGDWALVLNRVRGFTVTGNTITRATEDLIQVSRDSSHGLIENNRLIDVIAEPPAHPDLIQIQAIDGLTPSDIVVRGNHLYDDPATGAVPAQGIFVNASNGEGFRNILIEQNLLSVRHANSLYVRGGQENVVVRDNTLIAGPEKMKGGVVRLARGGGFDNSGVTLEGNIFARLVDETRRSRLGRNLIYGTGSRPGFFRGPGADWQDFVTPNPQFGALKRLEELRAGDGR